MDRCMTQVKFTIESEIVSKFKSRCSKEGVSMTSVIQQWMKTCQPPNNAKAKALTRPQRRKTVADTIGVLNKILYLEEQYRDSIPEQFTQRYDAADTACEQLAEAIACLEDAF